MSFDADPGTGVAVYDSYNYGETTPWVEVGGTSLSASCWGGLFAIADQGRAAAGGTTLDGPSQTLPALYSLPAGDFHDITSGGNGTYNAGPGYDFVTGLGTPEANLVVSDLASYELGSQLVVSEQPPSSVTAGTPFEFIVDAVDSSGNLETSFNGSVTISFGSIWAAARYGARSSPRRLTAWRSWAACRSIRPARVTRSRRRAWE